MSKRGGMYLKVVVLTNSIGGLWSFRSELMKRLLESGFEVSIHCPSGNRIEEFEELGCKVTLAKNLNRRGINVLQDIKLVCEYMGILRKEKPDVVLTYTIKPNIYGGIACQLCGIPYISNITGIGTAIAGKGLMAWLCLTLYKIGTMKVFRLFLQNESNLKLFEEKGIAKAKHRLIPGSGVNLAKHQFKDYPVESEKFRFLFVGRVMKAKGIEELLYAAEKICQERNDVSFDICGGCDEDKYLEQIDEISKKYDVKYHGIVKNIQDFYKNAHCVVLPSYHEGMANVLLEGQATGRPVISTRAPGCSETFKEGISGFACDAKDKESLLLVMKKMLNLSSEERAEMGRKGRKNVEDNFDRQIVTDAYMEEIQKILEEKKK